MAKTEFKNEAVRRKFSENLKCSEGFSMGTISLEDTQTLVDAFAWLIQEDKKQNPALYKQNNNE